MTTVSRTTTLVHHVLEGVNDVVHFRHMGQPAVTSAAGIALEVHPDDWKEMGSPNVINVTLEPSGPQAVAEPATPGLLDQPETGATQPAVDHTAALPVPMSPPTEGS